jgi:hypothetical protein
MTAGELTGRTMRALSAAASQFLLGCTVAS